MALAFKCDSCGDYSDGIPLVIRLIPPDLNKDPLHYELCPFCAEDVVNVIAKHGKHETLEPGN